MGALLLLRCMNATAYEDWLISLRRDLHRHPEPAWCEFYTTARIVETLRELGVDEMLVGSEVVGGTDRNALPPEAELSHWLDRARERDVDPTLLDEMEGGNTGVIATYQRGTGPTIALRVDIDALPRPESGSQSHVPVAEGFASEHKGYMHACGHDAHATIGLGVLRAIMDSDFEGTLKVIFQPAEEVVGGGKAVAAGGHLDDVDALFAVHVGLDHPSGEVVAGVDGFLAVTHLEATFHGQGAHAGGHPQRGRNAVQALATAIQNFYAIPRHEDGVTRVNAGRVGGGTATNVIPEEAFLEGEVRGGTYEVMQDVLARAAQIFQSAAEMHDCEVDITTGAEAPDAQSDDDLAAIVGEVATENDRVTSVLESDQLGGSEDATYLMQRVQNCGGLATYVCIGTDHPGGHHTATFDVDEESLLVGVEVLTDAILQTPALLESNS